MMQEQTISPLLPAAFEGCLYKALMLAGWFAIIAMLEELKTEIEERIDIIAGLRSENDHLKSELAEANFLNKQN